MKVSENSVFLRPVLNSKFPEKNGYSVGSIEIEDLDYKEYGTDKIDITFKASLEQPDIENLINQEDSIVCFLITDCSETNKRFYNEVKINQSNMVTFKLSDLSKNVNFHIFICANRDILNYSPKTVDHIYKINGVFNPIDIEKGELLAISKRQYITVYPAHFDHKIFSVVMDKNLTEYESRIDITGDRAKILVSEDLYFHYNQFDKWQTKGNKILDFSLFFAFFIHILDTMYPDGLEEGFEEKDIFQDYSSQNLSWFVAINNQVKSLLSEKIIKSSYSTYIIAQYILDNPLLNLSHEFISPDDSNDS